MDFSVDSEIGRLRQVILHRPGNEMLRLTPQNKDHLLFDDVLWLERAQEEHDQFARVLTGRDIEVLYLSDLLARTLEIPEARDYVLDRVVNENTNGPIVAEPLRALAQDLSGADLAEVLIAGITKTELLERTSCPDSLVLASMADGEPRSARLARPSGSSLTSPAARSPVGGMLSVIGHSMSSTPR